MAYYDAIANAIGARGNALAQGALQSGQVWGNLAANLGQIPGQAIAFHQQRQDALQNHELKKMALEKAQRDAEIEKSTIRIVNSNAPDMQKIAELKNVLRGDPEKFLALERLESEQMFREQQAGAQRYKLLEDQPGSVAPQGGFALPEPRRSEPGTSIANAFAPPTPIESQLVHPDIPGLGAPPTHHQNVQGKIAEIESSGLSPQDQEMAKKALFLPAAAFRASSSPTTALGITEWVSPDGTQKLYTQAMRNGLHVESGTGKVLDPGTLQGWTKIYHQPIQAFANQEGGVDVLNKEELSRRMSRGGQITGSVPDIRPKETLAPITSATGQITGTLGTRSGQVNPIGGGGAGGAPVYKGALSEGAQQARAQIQVFQDSLNKIGPLVEKHKDVVGRLRGNVEKGLAWAGWSSDEVDDLIGEMNTVKNTYIYMVSGKQINEAEQARLSAVMPDIGLPPARLKNNLDRFRRIVDTMAKARELGRAEGATPAELAAADPSAGSRAPAATGGAAVEPYKDPAKEARYQEYLLRNKGK